MLPRWKTQFFIKFFEGGIIMQEGNRGQPKEDPFHVFVPLLPLNMAQNDISDSPIPSWNVPGPWNYPETAVSRQLLLTTALWNYAKSAPKFLNMGLTPPPLLNDVQKNCGVSVGWHPLVRDCRTLWAVFTGSELGYGDNGCTHFRGPVTIASPIKTMAVRFLDSDSFMCDI